MATEPLLYTVEDVAEALRISRAHVYHFLATGQLDSVLLGRSRRIPADALAEFIKGLPSEREVAV
jgi:excisionase family DNA binding protein